MRKVSCPELCETCPIRNEIEGEPAIIIETYFDVEPALDHSTSEIVYSLDYKNGLPVSKRLSTLAIANETGKIGFRFRAQGLDWDDGKIENAFENCQGPSLIKSGFLNLRSIVVCEAMRNIN